MSLISLCEELESKITEAYESGVSMPEAEKLAAGFLTASLSIAKEMESLDLDKRMRKAGLKAIKAAVFLENATKGDKKPSDKMLEALVDSDKIVVDEQNAFDRAEVLVNKLNNYLSIFHEAHIYFRGIAKGNYE